MSKGRFPELLRRRQAFGKNIPILRREPLVLISMPMYKYPNPKTIVNMDLTRQHLNQHYPGIKLAVQTPVSTGIVQARSKVVAAVFENPEVTHLFFVDDDMRWPLTDGGDGRPAFNPIARFLSLGKDVVGGLGFTRHQPLRPFIGDHNPADGWGIVLNDVESENRMRAGEPFQVGYIGFGMVMISRRALEKVAELVGVVFDDKGKVIDGNIESVLTSETNWSERPGALEQLTEFLARPLGALLATGAMEEARRARALELVELVDRLVWKAKSFGEDWSFCRKARRAGLEVWVDPSFELGHYGDYSYSLSDFLAQQEMGRLEDAKAAQPA